MNDNDDMDSILFDRIDRIETLDDFINWLRDLSQALEDDVVTTVNPWTPAYLECMSAWMEASKHMEPLEVSQGSISLKSMARTMISSLSYE